MKTFKKIAALFLVAVLAVGVLAACGKKEQSKDSKKADGQSILWLSNLSSGPQYEAQKAYLEDLAKSYGYELTVAFGDGFNDPAGNLTAVKNGILSNCVGIIASQDGGIKDIMDAYPELWCVGFNTDMNSIYSDDPNIAVNSALKDNEKFLGTIADGHIDGKDTAKQNIQACIDKGYKKIGVFTFPGFAYPNLEVAAAEIVKLAAENGIEVAGTPVTLMFAPAEQTDFLDNGFNDVDAIVGLCAGTEFVYPSMIDGIANGYCKPTTKLITSGFSDDPSVIADIGGDGVIQYLCVSPNEDIGYSFWILHNAIKGTLWSDFTAERIDALEWEIKNSDDIANVMSKSLMTGDPQFAQIKAADLEAVSSYAGLKDLFHSDQLKVSALAK